jgi:ribonuclease J
MIQKKEDALTILPLGGLGEIGMNMMVLAWDGRAVIIDAGLLFPDTSMPGIDLVIPDMDALIDRGWDILGIVLTHGHEDHIGALPYVLRRISVPLYATNLTMGFVEHKLEEYGLLSAVPRNVISTESPLELGPFTFDFFAMCHSVPDGVGMAITTPAGVVIHSGDFKIDPKPIDGRVCDLEKISSFARRGVLVMLSDSTNAEDEGVSGSESGIGPSLEKIFEQAEGRVLIATFASSIHRIQQVLDISRKFNRRVALVGRSMATNAGIASERGYLKIPEKILVEMRDLEGIPDRKLTILSTGSQGEPLSALSLMAFDRHKYLSVKPGDVLVLSSRFIPGNERQISQIINEFARRGARVEYRKIAHVHVSGHANREELRTLIRLVRPRWFMPVHGEYRHLAAHARLAVAEGIPEERVLLIQDGDRLEISPDGAEVVERVDLQRIYVDGTGVGDVGREVLRDRRILSEVGVVTVAIGVDRRSGEVLAGPQVFSRGVTYEELEPELIEGVRQAVLKELDQLNPSTLEAWEESREPIRLAARRHVNRQLKRKPLVQTIILPI